MTVRPLWFAVTALSLFFVPAGTWPAVQRLCHKPVSSESAASAAGTAGACSADDAGASATSGVIDPVTSETTGELSAAAGSETSEGGGPELSDAATSELSEAAFSESSEETFSGLSEDTFSELSDAVDSALPVSIDPVTSPVIGAVGCSSPAFSPGTATVTDWVTSTMIASAATAAGDEVSSDEDDSLALMTDDA